VSIREPGGAARRMRSTAGPVVTGSRLVHWVEVHRRLALGLILLLALAFGAVRIGTDPPTMSTGQTERWWPVVLDLLQGQGYVQCIPEYFPFCGAGNRVTAMREPAPVLLFAAAARLAGPSLLAASILELVLNLAIVLGVFLLTREWAGGRAALLAALFWAAYLPAIKLVPQVSAELLAAVGVTWGVFSYLRARRTGRARDWVAAGACMGVGGLSRSPLLVVALVLAAGLLVSPPAATDRGRRFSWPLLRPAVLFSLAVLAVISPWLARNDAVFGRPMPSTLVGYNLYRHNHMIAADRFSPRFVGSDEARQAILALVSRRPDLRGSENEAQMDAVYKSEALRVIVAHPARYFFLCAYRFLPLWFNWGIKEAGGGRTGALDYLMILQQIVLLVTALAGWRCRRPLAWPLAIGVVALSVAYMAVNSQMRFIIPVMPLVASLSAMGCLSVARRAGRGGRT